jgi:peptide/nickel transport system permease protein
LSAPVSSINSTQARAVWNQLRSHRFAVLGSSILFVLYVGAVFAPFIAPYGLNEYSTRTITRYTPPTQVHWSDPKSGRITWPFVYSSARHVSTETFKTEYVEDRSRSYPLRLFVRHPEQAYSILGVISGDLHLFGVDAPAKIFLIGADGLGRDLFSRIWYGAQISLTIGLVAALLVNVLGILLGGLAGYAGGWLDNLIMRITEVIAVIPDVFLLIVLSAFIPPRLDPILVFYGMVLLLGLIGWGGLARVVRGQLLGMRELDYVQAAIALGSSRVRLVLRHMLPATASYLIVLNSLAIPGFILSESGLSFIGRGIREPYSSWGLLLNDVTQGGFASFTDRPWVLVPGLFIALTVLCWNFVGDGLRDALDPHGGDGV